MTEPLVQCRPRTNLLLEPDVFTEIVVVIDPSDNLPVIGLHLNTQRHVLQPGYDSPLCPGNKDGVIVVFEKSVNVASAVVTYPRPDLTEIKVTPKDRTPGKGVKVFIRAKYEEDKAITHKDKPRRATFFNLFTLPSAGTAVQSQSSPVTE